MKTGKLYGIGVGPGDPELITLKAIKAIEKADIIFVPKSKEQSSTALAIVKDYIKANALIDHLEFSMNKDITIRKTSRKLNATIIENNLDEGRNVAFLTLGDPMLYSTYSYILEYLQADYEVETIPGIYSFSAISNFLNKPLCKGEESFSVISSLRKEDELILHLSDSTVCMKVSSYKNELYNYLKKNDDYEFTMITDIGKTGQTVHKDMKILEGDVPYFSTAIVKKLDRY